MPFLAPPSESLKMRYPGSALLLVALCVHGATSRYDERLCNDGSYTSSGTDLEYVPNAWNPDEKGFSCIAIRDSPPGFDATWRWSSDPGSVHSYPHVKFSDSAALPVPLFNISALTLSAQWAMGPGSSPRPVPSIDLSGMKKLDVSANVAFDIFADRNRGKSDNEREAETEIMIWLGRVGHAQPLGYDGGKTSPAKMTVGHVEFALYQGKNQRGTSVFTWAAEEDEMSFGGDISPLLQYLWRNGLVSPGSYMGIIGFGTEGYHANGNVTFSASKCHANVLVGPAPALEIPSISEATSTSSASSPTGSLPADDCSSVAGRLRGSWLSSLLIGAVVGSLAVLF